MNASQAELVHVAARLVVEEGLEYAAAKRKALRALGPMSGRPALPSNEDLEREIRDYLALFCADTQPSELRALRETALHWLERLAEFRPHVGGAVWRGTATRRSALHIDLYVDDPKSPEIALINLNVDYDAMEGGTDRRGEPRSVLALSGRSPDWTEPVPVFLAVHDHDDVRGALKPDGDGRTWRGDARALARLLAEEVP